MTSKFYVAKRVKERAKEEEAGHNTQFFPFLPNTKICGSVENISFSFTQNNHKLPKVKHLLPKLSRTADPNQARLEIEVILSPRGNANKQHNAAYKLRGKLFCGK